MFVGAMMINTWCPLPEVVNEFLYWVAKRGLVLTLFFIGASLSPAMIKQVGVKPLLLAVVLWVAIGVSSLIVVLNTVP